MSASFFFPSRVAISLVSRSDSSLNLSASDFICLRSAASSRRVFSSSSRVLFELFRLLIVCSSSSRSINLSLISASWLWVFCNSASICVLSTCAFSDSTKNSLSSFLLSVKLPHSVLSSSILFCS